VGEKPPGGAGAEGGRGKTPKGKKKKLGGGKKPTISLIRGEKKRWRERERYGVTHQKLEGESPPFGGRKKQKERKRVFFPNTKVSGIGGKETGINNAEKLGKTGIAYRKKKRNPRRGGEKLYSSG